MRVTIDDSGDAAYIYLRDIGPGEVKYSHNCLPSDVRGHMINLDFDEENRLIGIEVLAAKVALPKSLLDSAEPIR